MVTVPNIPLILVVYAVVAATCLFVIWRAIVPPRGLPREAGCGNCRYQIAFNSATCPECGSDLRHVGAIPARTALRFRSNHFVLIVAWTALAAATYGVTQWGVVAIVDGVLPHQLHVDFDQTFQPRSRNGSELPMYEIAISGKVRGDVWHRFDLTVDPEARRSRTVRVTLDPASKNWTLNTGSTTKSGSGFDVAATEQFFEAARIDTSSEAVQTEIRQVSGILTYIIAEGPDTASRQNWGIRDERIEALTVPDTPEKRPVLSVLSELGIAGGGSNRRVVVYSLDGADEEITVQFEVQWNDGPQWRPEEVESLDLKIIMPLGWGFAIDIDIEEDTWAVLEGDQSVCDGTRPASATAVAPLIDRLDERTGEDIPEGLAADLATLINFSDDDLIGFTQWRPPAEGYDEILGGLRSWGGGMATNSISPAAPWAYVAVGGAFSLVWIVGGWLLIRHRRRAIAAPVD